MVALYKIRSFVSHCRLRCLTSKVASLVRQTQKGRSFLRLPLIVSRLLHRPARSFLNWTPSGGAHRDNMAKASCSPLVGWNKSLALSVLIVVWVIWSLSSSGTTDDVISRLPSFPASGISSSSSDSSLRPLILYTYAESDNARENLAFFVKNGLHGNADFVFIFNGETSAVDLLPEAPNVQIIQRDNKCFDIGAMGEILRKDDLWKGYKCFITMNASIRGPFFPVHSASCWTDTFLNRITDKVKVRTLDTSSSSSSCDRKDVY